MKKSFKPILLAISILIISASIAGCADNEKTTNTSVVSDTESTSGYSSSSSAEESVMSSTTTTTNSYDTTKPIDTTTPPASSGTESDTNSSSNSEPENSSSNSTPSSSSSSTNSSTNSSTSNSGNTSSSSSSTNSTPSSSSGTGIIDPITGKPDEITIPAGATGEYFDQYGNPMPDGFDPSKGGYYGRDGIYHYTPEEHAAVLRALQEAHDKIQNGTFNGTAGMTQADRDYLDSLLGI